jgi:murein DD-endopeptidase MepM/ murein hydrolase activator NlpD
MIIVLLLGHVAFGGQLNWPPDRQAVSAGYRWPLSGTPTVVVPFNPPAQPWLPGHRGVDLASTPGADVYAAGAGTVAFAGTVAGIGVVSVDHADGLRTTYEPVWPTVRTGQSVRAGAVIGVLGAGHPSCPVGIPACLHWGLRRGDTYLNPLLLLGLAQVRLLPNPPTG